MTEVHLCSVVLCERFSKKTFILFVHSNPKPTTAHSNNKHKTIKHQPQQNQSGLKSFNPTCFSYRVEKNTRGMLFRLTCLTFRRNPRCRTPRILPCGTLFGKQRKGSGFPHCRITGNLASGLCSKVSVAHAFVFSQF